MVLNSKCISNDESKDVRKVNRNFYKQAIIILFKMP